VKRVDVERLGREIDRELRAHGSDERAEHEKTYLKSALRHYGVSVPAVRKITRRIADEHPSLGHSELVTLVETLWAEPVHERRLAAIELLGRYGDRLGVGDAPLLERLLRESRTWALIDGLAANVVGPVVDKTNALGPVLDRWAIDDDFWMRRSALLALLVPLRRGDGDFDRFSRYADAMLDEREFFIRKAIGWVLRDTGKQRPDLVYRWLLPRAARASGVTIREAVKPLSAHQRSAILAAR